MALTWKRGLPFQHDGDVFEGTLAGRPAAAAASNAIYFATDNGIAYYSNGAAWSVVPFSTIDAAAVPDLSGTYQVRSERAAASGYASLDAGTKVPTAQLGGAGADNTKFLRGDQTWQVPSGASGVTSLAKSGSTGLTGAVTLTGGTNVTLTQAGQDISIAATGGGGALTQLGDTLLGAPTATLDVSGIAATANHLRVVVYARGDTAATSATAALRFNNDSSAIYYSQEVEANGATPGGVQAQAATSATIHRIPAGTAPASVFTGFDIMVPQYAATTGFKVATVQGGYRTTSAAGGLVAACFTIWWDSAAAINRITAILGAGNFDTGSRMTVYGLT